MNFNILLLINAFISISLFNRINHFRCFANKYARTIFGNNSGRDSSYGDIRSGDRTAYHGVGTDGDTVGYGNISYYGCAKTDKNIVADNWNFIICCCSYHCITDNSAIGT